MLSLTTAASWFILLLLPFIWHTLAGPAECSHDIHAAAARHTHHPARVHAQRLPTCDASGGDYLLYPQHHLNGDITASSTVLHLGMMSNQY